MMKKSLRNWVKLILCSGLICAGFTACSDDALEGEDQENLKDKSTAYLSVAFSTSSEGSSRSTADDANNLGDKDGSAEDSGHVNAGSSEENAVNSALVVVLATDKSSGFACLYDAPTNGFQNGLVAEDIKLSATTYDVLVVVNPYDALTSKYSAIAQGITEVKDVKELYQTILDGKTSDVTTDGGNWNNFSGEAIQVDATSKEVKGVMMANKENCQVTLSGDEEKTATVKVERVTSKITFRPKNGNVYAVDVVDLNSVQIETETVDNIVYNKATYTNNGVTQTIWVVLKKDGTFEKAYTKTREDDSFEEATTITSLESLENFKYVYKAGTYQTKIWYVKLEKYALVNLSKNVYNVRHTIAENSPAVPFGTLTGNNYLYTPNWTTAIGSWTINDVEFTETGEFDLSQNSDFKTNTWFYNTLADVSEDSKKAEDEQKYFAELKDAYTSSDTDKVTGTTHSGYESNPEIGNLLAYCLENSTVESKQTHGLSTGISFMAKIYSDKDCTQEISTLYRYNGYLFQSIDAIKQAYDIDVTERKEWAGIDESSTADELAEVNVVRYAGNTCYYYTTEIKHYDNDKPLELGNMEFAIMRNNIYSLSVNAVNIIGDPYVDPIPSTPNEVDKPKLDVKVEIMPWIVRYHDIEFN